LPVEDDEPCVDGNLSITFIHEKGVGMSSVVAAGFEQMGLVLVPEQLGAAQSCDSAAYDCDLLHVCLLHCLNR
jgi:hypothetical protein